MRRREYQPPTMLVLAARDDAVKRGSVSLLVDVRSLTPDRHAFNLFVRDVAAALEREGHAGLAGQARGVLDA